MLIIGFPESSLLPNTLYSSWYYDSVYERVYEYGIIYDYSFKQSLDAIYNNEMYIAEVDNQVFIKKYSYKEILKLMLLK